MLHSVKIINSISISEKITEEMTLWMPKEKYSEKIHPNISISTPYLISIGLNSARLVRNFVGQLLGRII
jgi:hypothetical protein